MGRYVHVVDIQQYHNESQNHVLNVKEDNTKAQSHIKCPQCMVQIQGTAVNILVDSGSPYTIISNENLFADIELCDSDITPGVIIPIIHIIHIIHVQRRGLVKPLAVGKRGQKANGLYYL